MRLRSFLPFLLWGISGLAATSLTSLPLKDGLKGLPLKERFPQFFAARDSSSPDDPLAHIIPSGLFVLGWSPKGRIAYLTVLGYEAGEAFSTEFAISDLVADKFVFKKIYEVPISRGPSLEKVAKAVFQSHAREMQAALEKNQIQLEGNLAPLSFPLDANGDSYSADLTLGKTKSASGSKDSQMDLFLVSKRKGRKSVHSEAYSGEVILDAKVAGFYRSPFENRLAILVAQVHRGYEGPPEVLIPALTGTDLEKAFP
jgi:hypothetical protein